MPLNDLADRLVAATYVMVLVGYAAIAPLAGVIGGGSRLVTIPFRIVVLALVVAVLLMALETGRMYSGSIVVPLILFWALYLMRLVLDTSAAPIDLRMSAAEYYSYAVGSTLLPMLALLVIPTARSLFYARRGLLYVGAIACVLNAVLAYAPMTGAPGNALFSARLQTETFNAISLGHTGVMVALLAGFELTGRPSRLVAFVSVLCLGLGIGVMTASGSRGPLLSLLVGFAALAAIAIKRGRGGGFIVALIAVAGASTVAFFAIEDLAQLVNVFRFGGVMDPDYDPSASARLVLFRSALKLFAENPFFGAHLELPGSGYYPHNIVLESLMTTGIIGGIALIIAIGGAFVAAMRVVRLAPVFGWVSVLFVQQQVGVQFSGAIAGSPEMWALLAAVVSIGGSIRPATGSSPNIQFN
jgi:O-antigen ligase